MSAKTLCLTAPICPLTADAMSALGDKIGSTILAQAAGVPTIPWSGTGVAVSFEECNGNIPPDVYDRACVQSGTASHNNARSSTRLSTHVHVREVTTSAAHSTVTGLPFLLP